MSISSAQLKEAARLLHGMLLDAAEEWKQRHLLVWRSAR
jgi:hypothetical protein